MEYTIEQFQQDFEIAPNTSAKSDVLNKALNELDLSNPEVKEILTQYRDEFKDYREQLIEEENTLCNSLIEKGEYEVYLCKEDLFEFQKGSPYYIKVDDVAKVYEGSITAENPIIKEYISKIEPMIWTIVNDGVGTKSRRVSYPKSVLRFEEVFEKIS